MTQRRCQIDGHAIFTRTQLCYVGLAHNGESTRYRLRFCRPHAIALEEDLSQFEVNPEDGTLSGGDTAETQCLSCGKPVDETGWQVFLTTYPTKDERKDYWSRLHVDCRMVEPLGRGPHAE